MGTIPDWNPIYYQWKQVKVPYYVQNTEAARRDIAAQYTTISRLDKGISKVLFKKCYVSNMLRARYFTHTHTHTQNIIVFKKKIIFEVLALFLKN